MTDITLSPQNYGDELPAKGVLYPVPRNLYTSEQLHIIERYLSGPASGSAIKGENQQATSNSAAPRVLEAGSAW